MTNNYDFRLGSNETVTMNMVEPSPQSALMPIAFDDKGLVQQPTQRF